MKSFKQVQDLLGLNGPSGTYVPHVEKSCSIDWEQITVLLDVCGSGFAFSLLRCK